MDVSPKIKAAHEAYVKVAQEAYRARPYAVRLRTSHYSAESRFHTLPDAIAYLSEQYARAAVEVANTRYRSFDARRSALILPGEIEVRCDEFIGDSLSSY